MTKHGFTLAEVLITLGIIGIVASMTLPAIVKKNNEKATVSKLKKVYSVLQQAQLNIINEYGTFENFIISNTNTGQDENGENILDYANTELLRSLFAKQLKVIQSCDAGQNCLGKTVYKLSGDVHGVYKDPTLILADGTKLFFGWTYACSQTSICAEVGVALPGANKNRYTLGKDIFYFHIYSQKIIPAGKTSGKLADDSCSIKADGHNCAAWVIFNENMDYTHCDDLEWGRKTKCNQK